MYYSKTWVFLRLILHTLSVRFRLCTGPTRLLLWFEKPQLAISDCLYQFLLVFSNRLQRWAFLARSSGFCARLITIGAVVLWLQGRWYARSEPLDHLRRDLHNSTYHLPTKRSGLSSHYTCWGWAIMNSWGGWYAPVQMDFVGDRRLEWTPPAWSTCSCQYFPWAK